MIQKKIGLLSCIKQPNDIHSHLLVSAAKVSLVPFKYLTESHFLFPRIHHAGIVVLQEGLSSRSKLVVNILTEQIWCISLNNTAHWWLTPCGEVSQGLFCLPVEYRFWLVGSPLPRSSGQNEWEARRPTAPPNGHHRLWHRTVNSV